MNLSARLVVAMISVVLVTAVVQALIVYRNLAAAITLSEHERLQTHAERLATGLTAFLHETRADVEVIRGAPALGGMIQAAETVDDADPHRHLVDFRKRLQLLFVSMLDAKPEYTQLRLIEADGGREIVRVDRSGPDHSVRVVPDDELQHKGSRDFVRKSLGLAAGKIYTSPIELNREHGEIEVVYVPVLRVATALYGQNKQPFGVAVINIDMRSIFSNVRSDTPGSAQTYVVNSAGDYLVHPDPSLEFGFDLGRRVRIQDEFEDVSRLLQTETTRVGIVRRESGESCYAAVSPIALDEETTLFLVRTVPESVVLAPATMVRGSFIYVVLFAAVLAGVVAMVATKTLTKPLVEMTKAVDTFSSDAPSTFPTTAAGEIGVLARAFDRMSREVTEKTELLEREVDERRRTETRLREGNQREKVFAAVMESTQDAILVIDINGTITAWNRGAQMLYGYSEKEAIGKSVAVLTPPEGMDDLRDMLSRLWRGEQIVQHQTVRIDRSGKRMDVSLTISPFQNESGIIAGASEIARDITERARDEMKFRMAVEASPNGMVLVDSSGSILLINAEAERLFGYDREELLGQPVECLVPQRFRSDHPRLRSGYFSNPSMRTMGEGRDLFGLRKDGVEIPVEIGLNPIQTDTEVLVLAAVVDISERRQRDELVRIAFEAAPSGMLMVDQQGKITMVNSQLEGIFGYQRDEMLGSPVEMLLPKELRGEHAQLFAEFIKHPAPRAMGEGRVFVGVRKDEREVPIEIGLVPITHYQGIHVLAAIVDISERKKMDAQLRFKNEEMEQLLYVVSHDLKSPLVTIEGFSGFLLRYAKAGDLDKVEDAVGRIQRGVKSMARLIDDLLELSRVGRTENERLELDVRSIVSEVVESLDGAIRKAEAVVEVDEFLPNIQADHTQFVQVIMNLVANALKYGCPEPGCRIRIGAMRQPGQIKLFVRDEGPGIDAQFHAKIFQLFQRLSTDQEGTGLGLTTVARVMESHGGRVWVESQPGCGATFWISFPDHPAERAFALSKPAATELAATR